MLAGDSRKKRTASTPNRSMAKNGLTTLPTDLDILRLLSVQWPCVSTLRGSGRSAAMRSAGQ